MGTILNYLQSHGNLDFDQFPFNDVDSLILAEMSYLLWDGFVPDYKEDGAWVPLHIFQEDFVMDLLVAGSLEPKRNRKLLAACIASRRFGSMKLNYYHSKLDSEEETQFSAVTFQLKQNLFYIAFRGTDASILGWKEDFNMAFLSYIPGQREAKAYLEYVADKLDGNLLIGGHSKGGNLSLFSSTFCRPDIQPRILRIFDHDGPGFKEPIFDLPEFKAIEAKVSKTIPHDSFVGILLHHYDRFRVVKSLTIGVLQHDVFSWSVENGSFTYMDKTTYNSRLVDQTLYDWMSKISDENRSEIVNVFFDVIASANLKSLHDLRYNILKNLRQMLKKITSLDRKTKKLFFKTVKDLVFVYFKNVMVSIQNRVTSKQIEEQDEFDDFDE